MQVYGIARHTNYILRLFIYFSVVLDVEFLNYLIYSKAIISVCALDYWLGSTNVEMSVEIMQTL